MAGRAHTLERLALTACVCLAFDASDATAAAGKTMPYKRIDNSAYGVSALRARSELSGVETIYEPEYQKTFREKNLFSRWRRDFFLPDE